MFSIIAAIVALPDLALFPVSDLFQQAPVPQLIRSSRERLLTTKKAIRIAQIDPVTENPDISQDLVKDEISRLLAVAIKQSLDQEAAAAADSYRRALALMERLEKVDPLLKAEALWGLGRAYAYLQEDDNALPILEEALALYEMLEQEQMAESIAQVSSETPEVAYADIQMDLYGLLGAIYDDRANYAMALRYNQQALALAEILARRWEQANFQYNVGLVTAELGQYEQAEEALNQSIVLNEQIEQSEKIEQSEQIDLTASVMMTLGGVSEQQQNYGEAITHYQEAIILYETLKTADLTSSSVDLQSIISRQVRVFNNLGMVYLKQGNQTAAQTAFEHGVTLLTPEANEVEPQIWVRERAILVNSLGELSQAKGDRDQAFQFYLQAFQLAQQEEDKIGEIEALLNFGRLMEAEEQPNLAIFFYKQAIARIEIIRENLQPLSQSVQQRYTQTVEDFYRNLAGLLLQQNRESEALQVLELLKLQEIRSYLQNDQAQGREESLNTREEAALLEAFDVLPLETSLVDFLASDEAIAVRDFTASIESNSANPLPFNLASLQAAVAAQPVKTAVLYPLILENRLEIILLSPDGTLEHFATPVSKEDLSKTIEDFQRNLKNRSGDVTPSAQRLHEWLIQPLESTLAAQQVQNIIYLPDGILRYVPLAALHDGEQWLVETYQSHNITAATVDDLVERNPLPLSVIAGAFTDSSLSYPVPESDIKYSGLSTAIQEINNLVTAIPDTQTLLNQDFTSARMLEAVGDRRILHLATHAQFLPGQPEASFILFGDGDTADMREIRQWQLPTVDLVVLSACETATSIVEGDGKEILGLGYQIQQTGAGAAIASLWAVNDESTAALMSQFYQALSRGQTKAEALQYAQQRLIASDRYSRPYDWAAFILIGNGL